MLTRRATSAGGVAGMLVGVGDRGGAERGGNPVPVDGLVVFRGGLGRARPREHRHETEE